MGASPCGWTGVVALGCGAGGCHLGVDVSRAGWWCPVWCRLEARALLLSCVCAPDLCPSVSPSRIWKRDDSSGFRIGLLGGSMPGPQEVPCKCCHDAASGGGSRQRGRREQPCEGCGDMPRVGARRSAAAGGRRVGCAGAVGRGKGCNLQRYGWRQPPQLIRQSGEASAGRAPRTACCPQATSHVPVSSWPWGGSIVPIVQARRLGPGEGLKGKSTSPGVRPGLESSCVSLGMALGAARGLGFPVYSMSSA